jgi:tetratricopeptide (TPR) repeat protein
VLQEKIDKNARGGCAAAVARDLARLGDIDAALKEATNVVNPNTHLKVIAEIAMAQVLAEKEAAALETVAGLTADTERIFVLHQIGYAQAKAGNKAGAKESFRRAVELADKSESGLFYNVALAQAAAGDISGAVQTAENHDAPNELWSRIALRQLRFGDYSGARQTLEKHEWGGLGQTSAVLRMAADQARDGHEKEAREWMAKETDPLVRAHAFVGLAKGLCPEDGSRTPAAATAK